MHQIYDLLLSCHEWFIHLDAEVGQVDVVDDVDRHHLVLVDEQLQLSIGQTNVNDFDEIFPRPFI